MNPYRHAIRINRENVAPLVERFSSHLGEIYPCGSWRRQRPTLGDLDIITTTPFDPDVLFHSIEALRVWKGERSYFLHNVSGYAFMSEVSFVPPDRLGAAMLRWTGSVEWLWYVRQRARERGFVLKESGLYRGQQLVHAETEEGILDALEMGWVPPKFR